MKTLKPAEIQRLTEINELVARVSEEAYQIVAPVDEELWDVKNYYDFETNKDELAELATSDKLLLANDVWQLRKSRQ